MKIVGYQFLGAWCHIDADSPFDDKMHKQIKENVGDSDIVNAAVIYFPSNNPETADIKPIIEKVREILPKRGYEFGLNFLPNSFTLQHLRDTNEENFNKTIKLRKKFFNEFDKNLIVVCDPYPISKEDVFKDEAGMMKSTEEILRIFHELVRRALKSRMKLVRPGKLIQKSPNSPKANFDPALKSAPALSPPTKRKFDQVEADSQQGPSHQQGQSYSHGPAQPNQNDAILAIAASLATATNNQGTVNNLAEVLMAHVEQGKNQTNQQHEFLNANYQQQQKLLEDNVKYLAQITTHMGQTVDKVQSINTQGAVVNLIDQSGQSHNLQQVQQNLNQVQNNLHQHQTKHQSNELKNLHLLNANYKEKLSSGRLRSGNSGSQTSVLSEQSTQMQLQ